MGEDAKRRAPSDGPGPPIARRQTIVRRARLLDALQEHLGAKLLLITADAGYGKTTLLSALIEESGIPCAWCRLEPSDRDPAVFLQHLSEAIRVPFPQVGPRLRGVLQAGTLKHSAAMAHLIGELRALPEMLIGFDDFHLVDESQEVNALVDDLLDHLPPSAHCIVSTRTTPHLALARLRAQSSLFELDAGDLRFSPEETAALFTLLGLSLDPETFQSVASRTEGWVLAVVLAYHSIKEKGPDEVRGLLQALRGSARYIYGYLSAEVFKSQPQEVQDFLRSTWVFSRLHPDLCDAILGGSTARATLRYLEGNNLFTHALDEAGTWYRYHPLFREFLEARLLNDEGTERATALRLRAGATLEQRGLLEEAFEQYGRAGQWTRAARLLSEMGDRLLESGRLQTLRAALDHVPPSIADTVPGLQLLQGQLMELQGRWVEARGEFQRAADGFTAAGDAAGTARGLAGAALTHFRQGQYPRCRELCEQALRLTAGGDGNARAEILRLLAGCHLETDDLDQGARYMEEALQEFRLLGHRQGEARALHDLAYSVHFVRGEFASGLQMEEEAVRICEERGDIPALMNCLIGLGHLRLVMGHHQEALTVLRRLLRMSEEWEARGVRAYALMLQADARRELGDDARARALYEESLVLGDRLEEPTARLHPLLGQAVLLRRADPGAAVAAARRALALAERLNYRWFVGRSLMTLGAAIGTTDGHEATVRLARAVEIFERLDARYDLARTHLLFASVCPPHERGPHLDRVLTLAERGGYDALFLHTEREAALPLLVEAVAGRMRPEYAGKLLAAAGTGDELIGLLHHASAAVRAQTARLLAGMGMRQARGGLRRLLRDADQQVREAAMRGLEQLATQSPMPLRVQLLGDFRLWRGDEEIGRAAWKRGTARTLFQYLIAHRLHPTPEDVIVEALWPQPGRDGAHAVFHAALHAARKVLEPDLIEGRDSAYIVNQRDRYGLNPRAEYRVDADEFERLVRLGKTHEQAGRMEEAITALGDADRLYAGDYLADDPYQEWPAADRERFRTMEVDVLVRLGDLLATRDPGAAVDAYRRAAAMEPYSEPAHRGLMRLLAAMGQRAEALRQYRILEDLLDRDLHAGPSDETAALYRRLLDQAR